MPRFRTSPGRRQARLQSWVLHLRSRHSYVRTILQPFLHSFDLSPCKMVATTMPKSPSTSSSELEVECVESQITSSPPWNPSRREYLIMVTLAMVSFIVALDATILVPVLPNLALSLHGTSTQAFWAGTSYLLTSAVFQPFIGALSDAFGRRGALLSSLSLFTAGTVVCTRANSFTILLLGRSAQGIGKYCTFS